MPLPERPRWLENAIQGLAFWIGHRRAMFPHYPLSEGALVAELCNLIQVNLGDDHCLFPEIAYSRITTGAGTPEGIPTKARADLVLFNGSRSDIEERSDLVTPASAVIEVKRASAGPSLINDDLRRLAQARQANMGMRGFLVVASEAKQPARFVARGISKRGKAPIPGLSSWYYRVRRTTKAASSYKALQGQHYICMIEVFRYTGTR